MQRSTYAALALVLAISGCARQPTKSDPVARDAAYAQSSFATPSLPIAMDGDAPQHALLRVVDVGAGMCVVGRTPNGYGFLVDAGAEAGSRCVTGIENTLPENDGNKDLSLVIISHTDADHYGNLAPIAIRHGISEIIWNGRTPHACQEPRDNKCATAWPVFLGVLDALEELGEDARSLADEPLKFGEAYELDGVEIQLVAGWQQGPWEPRLRDGEANNAVSIVVRVIYDGKSVLIAGDTVGRHIGDAVDTCDFAEALMVQNAVAVPIASDVLVAPHHGADNGSSACFIEAVDPAYVVFSAGKRYDHPRRSTAKRYLDAGISRERILRTDRGSAEGSGADADPETHTEWVDEMVERCGDGPGDDDVLIRLPKDGQTVVSYADLDRCPDLR